MSTILKLLGLLFLAVLACALYFYFQIPKMEHEALAYVRSTQPAIIARWDERAFLAETPPQLLREHSRSEIDLMFANYSRLGKLKIAQPTEGKIVDFPSTLLGKPWQAIFTTHAQFDRGNATIITPVAKLDGEWKIVGLFVVSSSFTREFNAAARRNVDQRFSRSYRNPLDAPPHR